jgi:hypothetical protein
MYTFWGDVHVSGETWNLVQHTTKLDIYYMANRQRCSNCSRLAASEFGHNGVLLASSDAKKVLRWLQFMSTMHEESVNYGSNQT